MASGDSPGAGRLAASSSATGIRRTVSSQSVAFNVRSADSPGMPIPRRQSTQARISEILEVGRQRAGSMHLQSLSPGRTPTMPSERDSPSSGYAQVDEPDERTSFGIARNMMNYQSTQTTASLRSRQPPPQPDSNPTSRNGSTVRDAEEKRHWLWGHLDGIWSIELENKGSVARDHLAVGMFGTDVSRLAADIPRIRLDRDSDHPAVSPKRYLERRADRSTLSTARKAARRDFHRYIDISVVVRIPEVLRTSAVATKRKIPGV
ncbi:hypothetical protein F5Y10DRAFT_77424 [Nemania abortiva]|nr:hypothetical protein F5Y10DRAFT_77424 [Nemania abortiva]